MQPIWVRDSVLVAVELKSFKQGYSKGGSKVAQVRPIDNEKKRYI